MRPASTLSTLIAAALLAGCGSADEPTTQPIQAQPQPSAPPSSAADPSPEPTENLPLKLGALYKFTDGEVTAAVTALGHKSFDQGYAVEVRTCNQGSTTFKASTLPWLLSYGGGEQLIDVTITGGGLPAPAFTERDLVPGKCARGWISFEVPKTGKPDGVEYHVPDVAPARWQW